MFFLIFFFLNTFYNYHLHFFYHPLTFLPGVTTTINTSFIYIDSCECVALVLGKGKEVNSVSVCNMGVLRGEVFLVLLFTLEQNKPMLLP